MQEKLEHAGRKWVADGVDIDVSAINEIVYINSEIETFLESKNFLSANKGMGKTLLMTFKRHRISSINASAVFIPRNQPYLDCMGMINDFSKNMEIFLGERKNAIRIWLFCLRFSVITYVHMSLSPMDKESLKALPKQYFEYLESEDQVINPTEIFENFVKGSPNELNKNTE